MIYNIPPCAKPRMVSSDKWKKRPVVLKYWAFKDECRLKGVKPDDGQDVTFYMPMAASWSKKRKEKMDGKPHKQTPDLDNLLKGLWDILKEDSHIASVTARKVWAYSGAIEINQI